MNLRFFVLFVSVYFSTQIAFSSSGSGYSVCTSVSSGYFADIRVDRTIIVNYERSSDHFVVLRCGSDQEQRLRSTGRQNDCHVYRTASKVELCSRERAISRTTRFISAFLDGAVDAAVSGGASTLDKLRVAVEGLRSINMEPSCPGVSLLKNIATGSNVESSAQVYYNTIIELGPFTGLVRFANKNSEQGQNKIIFDSLDSLLIGDNGSRKIAANNDDNTPERIRLRGPAYMVSQRNQDQTNLLVNEEVQAGLCGKFPNIASVQD